jgi:hypothetical protein
MNNEAYFFHLYTAGFLLILIQNNLNLFTKGHINENSSNLFTHRSLTFYEYILTSLGPLSSAVPVMPCISNGINNCIGYLVGWSAFAPEIQSLSAAESCFHFFFESISFFSFLSTPAAL